ncbi:MAG: tRNA-dihydrouridine synthase [archaeon]|nr:tRNA-dihydrouridine synthase [archaeon]
MLPKFSSKAFLAPMAGVSDPALRLICKELGAGLVVTEFTSIHAITAKRDDITKFIEFSPKEKPISVQLFGSDLEKLKQAVKIVEPHFDIIDYNLGCPAPHLTQQMACSALLQEPELTRKIFRTMVKATKKPITIKIRSGVSLPDKWKEIALIAEEEGIAMITFHPRTVKQGYSGQADWSLITELKELVSIPVVGNGDVQTPEDAKRMFEETGCDYVMIGRAAGKNPFIFTQINDFLSTGSYKEVDLKERIMVFFRYLEYSKMYPTIKFVNIRMQAMNFTKGVKGGKGLREKLMKAKDIEELKSILEGAIL